MRERGRRRGGRPTREPADDQPTTAYSERQHTEEAAARNARRLMHTIELSIRRHQEHQEAPASFLKAPAEPVKLCGRPGRKRHKWSRCWPELSQAPARPTSIQFLSASQRIRLRLSFKLSPSSNSNSSLSLSSSGPLKAIKGSQSRLVPRRSDTNVTFISLAG